MKIKQIWITLLAFILVFASINTAFAVTAVPSKINLSENACILYVGNTKELSVKSEKPQNVIWKTSNKKVVSVSKNGVVKGIKQGKATIIAVSKINGKRASCTVIVKEKGNMQTKPEANVFYIKVGEKSMQAVFENNSSAEAFKDLLKKGNVTVSMSDYGNFEKVGSLGTTLPRNDKQITTVPGDIILYQGNSITIYYDTNSWSFTRLGKIEGATTKSMKDFLGNGNVSVTFSLSK